jgi:hypothetical protein
MDSSRGDDACQEMMVLLLWIDLLLLPFFWDAEELCVMYRD